MSTKEFDYDVLYLGSGHGTFDGAIPLAATGKRVAVVESGLIGGTCPNRGCNAKITLDAPVALQQTATALQGLVSPQLELNWNATVAHKHEVIKDLPGFIAGLLKDAGVTLFKGRGHFIDPHTIAVGTQQLSAEKIVIATGLHPHRLDIPGRQLAHDSREFMNLQELPHRIVIIGAGYISLEFATIANAFGAQVTVLLRGDKALRKFHQPFVQKLLALLEKRGVTFIKNTTVTSFSEEYGVKQVHYNQTETVAADWILDATGRNPNTEGLGLTELGVAYDEAGIIVNDHLQTTVPNIYASGDVIKKKQPRLTPTAIFESKYLQQLFAGTTTAPIDYPAIPSVVFSSPRIAWLGLSPVQAAQDAAISQVHHNVLDNWYRHVEREQYGENILLFDKEHHLVGATEISEHAEDVINALLPALELKLDPAQVGRLIHLFPTISSAAWEGL
ncbi:dihydrolipoyl dehydrogenase family protein [Liquorilactobacillus satsumensis]|uniref:Glutathione reductase n=1 Tax=Liquorilactobacillus satsumensis DSM 16230 = JCM 12392 TaxID=1423801 RepID=A0A0R1V5C3_9LACO|nr:NAD(P)/FAD-dependent oxidoreductase [Liquorilactobacillus satsumensis]KRL99050.1 glutathione reductase [Liquorilactobacillus satsumensis DSM 16230 = JCM 12392]